MSAILMLMFLSLSLSLDKHSFKSVKSSGDPNLLFLPTNLHLQKLHVLSSSSSNRIREEPDSKRKDAAYCFVTMGSPTITNCSYNKSSKGDGHRGLRTVISSLKSVPSFVPQKVSTTAGLVLAELSEFWEGEGGREGGRGRKGGREGERGRERVH